MGAVDSQAGPAQPDFVGALLVADTRAFVEAWRVLIDANPRDVGDAVSELRERSKTLQLRARAAGVGGLAHHLVACDECLEGGTWDPLRLEERLRNVLALAWQVEQDLELRRELPPASAPASVPAGAAAVWPSSSALVWGPSGALVPAPSGAPDSAPDGASGSAPDGASAVSAQASDAEASDAGNEVPVAPPPLLSAAWPGWKRVSAALPIPSEPSVSADAAAPSALPTLSEPLAVAAPAAATPKAPAVAASRASSVEPPAALPTSRPEPAAEEAFPDPPVWSASVADPPAQAASNADPSPPAVVPAPPARAASIFDPPSSPAAVPSPPARAASNRAPLPALAPIPSPPAWLGSAPIEGEPPDPVREGTNALSQVLGLAPLAPRPRPAAAFGVSASAPAPAPGAPAAAAGASARPPRLELDSGGLPLLGAESDVDDDLTDRDLEIRLERVRRAAPYPLLGREIAIDLPPESEAFFRGRFARTRPSWWVAPVVLGVLGSVVALLAMFGGSGREGVAAAPITTTRSEALLPVPRFTDEQETLKALLSQVHAHGGVESAELAALLDEEEAVLAKALAEPCAPGSLACRLTEQSREMLTQPPVAKSQRPVASPGDWLTGLDLPQIGVKDDPRVRKIVEYHTKDPGGRELFQGLLYRCAPHQELFRDTLQQHGLPVDLIALVMVESGCVSDAESPVGARGLWQFMPATARAYHLRVQSGVIDERLSATKSTDAALEFLRDLYGKLRSWELALASYNMGPFGLLARMKRAGGDVGFWDLVDAGRLPAETAAYVPKIEAFALILANLERFRFARVPPERRPPSSPLLVPAGTRLGMVARAASSSASRIRELNPELIAETVPGATGQQFELRVPSDAAASAGEQLQRLLAQADDADECVPSSFDWGRQQPTRAMLSRCRR